MALQSGEIRSLVSPDEEQPPDPPQTEQRAVTMESIQAALDNLTALLMADQAEDQTEDDPEMMADPAMPEDQPMEPQMPGRSFEVAEAELRMRERRVSEIVGG